MKKTEKRTKYNMVQNVCFLVKLVWKAKEKRIIFLSLAFAFTTVFFNLINLFISPVILSVIENGEPVLKLIETIVIFTFGLILCSALSSYFEQNIYPTAGRGEIIAQINKKISITSYPNLIDDKFQKLKSQCWLYTGNNASSTEDIWRTLTTLLINILGFIFYLTLMSSINPLLILVVLVTAILGYFITNWATEWRYKHRSEIAESGKQMLYINQKTRNVTFAKDIRIFGLQPWLESLYEKAMNIYLAKNAKAETKVLYASIADLLFAFLRNGIAYTYLIYLVLYQNLSVSEFLLYFTAIGGFSAWVTGILSGFSKLKKQSLEISEVRECLDYPEPFKFEGGEELKIDNNEQYEIKLENVSYRYPSSKKNTLSNINLTLKQGEKLAVVGLNGAGKTTLIKIICGFLDPTEGCVLLNGKDIRLYNRATYYNLFSAVFQTFSVLPATIKENIVQDTDEGDIDRINECIEKAGLTHKINSLKDGLNTYLNREVYNDAIMLSGGETQRLMLARSLYKDAPIIVLDEPTAALDPIAESELYQKYDEMTEGKSSIYISHRLASTRFCDRIILINNGIIAEEGNHDELLALGGEYAHLFNVQKKYYEEGGNEYEEN